MAIVPAPTVSRLGRYEVIRHLASGGMAEIYLARDGDQVVVVKVIGRDRGGDKKFIQMFLDEARVAATLHHPNIAQMLEVGLQDDTYFLAMEYVDGDTVRALLERSVAGGHRVPRAVCLRIVAAVAAGLHHAHERKGATGEALEIVHRDVTPSNIMVGWDGAVKLLDFGIARANNRAAETQSGTIKGKFAYMSPEQCRGKGVDRRTDVFALGIVMYELTTQRRAFRAESDFEAMDRIVKGKLVRPTELDADYPRDLEQILMRALATDADARFPTAAAMADAIDQYARATGQLATDGDVAACMHQVFHGGQDPLAKTIESTSSDIDLEIVDDPGRTLPRLARAEPAAADDLKATLPRWAGAGAPSPAMTGPLPVMPARASSSMPLPQVALLADAAVTTGPQALVPDRASPLKTIMGTGPMPAVRPPSDTNRGATEAGRARPGSTGPAAAGSPDGRAARPDPSTALATIAPLAETTQLRRRNRRGLTLALVAIVVVVAVAVAVIILGGDPPAEPTAPAAPAGP
ncbi:MAG: protein kinase [Kofleriaceae bacterium]